MHFRSLVGPRTAAHVWFTMVLQVPPWARPSVVAPAPATPVRRQAFLRRVSSHERTPGMPMALVPHDLRAAIHP